MKITQQRRPRSITTILLIALVSSSGCDSTSEPTGVSEGTTPSATLASSGQTSADGRTSTPESDAASGTSHPPTGGEVSTPAIENPSSESSKTSPSMSSEAFREAALEGRTAEVKRGLESGINIEAVQPGREHTALHMAAFNGHTETVLFLLKKGANVDCRDFEGKTPLIHACTGPYAETVEALIKAGADVNAKGSTEGFTPLMMAAGLDQLKIVQILLANKAEKETFDDDNDKAIDHARRAGHKDIVDVLK